MKEWKKALIAFGPIMLALWFVIGYCNGRVSSIYHSLKRVNDYERMDIYKSV